MPVGAQHVHDFDEDRSKCLPQKIKVLVESYVKHPERKVSTFEIWGALATKQGVDLSLFPATKENKEQVSWPGKGLAALLLPLLKKISATILHFPGHPLHPHGSAADRECAHRELVRETSNVLQ